MAFEQLIPRPLTLSGIQMYAPAVSGVYGITNANEWIYIGQANNIRDGLLAHLRDNLATLTVRAPVGFVFEACVEPHRSARLDRLTREYSPTSSSGSATPADGVVQRKQYGT